MSETACKKCGGKTLVTNTWRRGDVVKRRRECPKCYEAFVTEQPLPAKEKRVNALVACAC